MNIDFKECPQCHGYGVRDNGDNCTECGGVGRGGLSTNGTPGNCIGSGEIMIDRDTRRRITTSELLEMNKARAAAGGTQ